MRSTQPLRLAVLIGLLAAGQAWSLPGLSGLEGPLWFYEHSPGLWLGRGGARLAWEGASGRGDSAWRLAVEEAGQTLGVLYPGSSAEARAGLCAGQTAPVRWFRGRGGEPARQRVSGPCLEIKDLWPGISLRLAAAAGRVKSEYVVEPGADPGLIRVAFEKARGVRVTASGELAVETATGIWREAAPSAWTEPGGAVPVRFQVGADGTAGFEVEPAADRRLIIDPAISYSGVFGGSGASAATSMAVDSAGMVYVAGYTDAADFPMAAAVLPRGGGVDGILLKLDPSTGRLLWANYIGGSGDDRVLALAAAPGGAIYAAGSTSSANFPVSGPLLTSNRGGTDAFLLKFTADGSLLEFSSYLGGTQSDSAAALAATAAGVWVGGQTSSTNFPVAGALQSSLRGGVDAFLARYSSGGALEYSSFIGGSGDDYIKAIAVASTGEVFVGGATGSGDLAIPPGAAQPALRGALDGFVLKLSASGGQIVAGTFLGGSGGSLSAPERVETLLVDGFQNVYAAGLTPSSDFPTPQAWFGTLGGTRDGFLVKLHPGLNGLAWGTFLGGGGQEMINAAALLADGSVAVAGSTSSVNFPQQSPVGAGAYRGSTDGFVTVFTADGASVPFSTYLGGTASDAVFAMCAASGNTLIVAGQSGSADLPLRGFAPPPPGNALRFFVTRLTVGAAPVVDSITPLAGSGAQTVFEIRASHPNGAGQISSVELGVGDLSSTAPGCRIRWSASTGKMWVLPEAGVTAAVLTPGTASTSAGVGCTLSGAASSVVAAGNTITVRMDVSFPHAMAGARAISANAVAADGAESGFAPAGSWTVPDAANTAPGILQATASPSKGASALFLVKAYDGNGAGDLARVRLIVGNAPLEAGACAVEYDRAAGLMRLVNDFGNGWYSAAVGSTAVLANSLCQLRIGTTQITMTSTNIEVRFDLLFAATNTGLKNIYAQAQDRAGVQSSYALFGQFTVLPANNAAPAFVSLSPAIASGATQRFSVTYTDANGEADLAVLRLRINSAAQDAAGCVVQADRRNGSLSLRDNPGTGWLSTTLGSATPVANSQCQVKASNATLTAQSSQVTFSVEITFYAPFNGSKTVWTSAEDLAAATPGWQQNGSFSVAVVVAQSPVALSVTPNTGSGPAVTLTAAWTDANGAQDIRVGRVLVNAAQRGDGGCYVAFDRQTLAVSLADDAGAGWSSAPAGSASTLSNSQCTVHASGVLFSLTGSNLVVSFQFSFKPAFNGAKSVWANATDVTGLTSDSPWLGSYTVAVPVNQAPVASAVAPSSGSGGAQVFTFTWSDANGGADIVRAEILIHSQQTASWGCYIQVRPLSGTVALASDDGGAWAEVTPGSAGSASNSQCTLRGAGSLVQVGSSSVTSQLDILFTAAFNGPKSIWANALDASGLLSATPLLGAFTVSATAAVAPAPVSVSPSNGSGAGQVVQFVWTDANGGDDIEIGHVLINSAQTAANGCYFAIDRAAGAIILADDGGNLRWTAKMGTNDSASNSYCSVMGQGSSLQIAGTSMSAFVDLRFKSAFNGLKAIWMNARDRGGLYSPSPQLGSYNVISSTASAPAPAGVSPASASGSRQLFTFNWTDANGAADIAAARVLIHSVQQANQGCYIQVEGLTGRVLLADDAAATSSQMLLGAAQTLQNSQCRIYGAGSWAALSGNTLTVILDIGFLPAFAGAKTIWMNATDSGGLTSPSPQAGSYTVLP